MQTDTTCRTDSHLHEQAVRMAAGHDSTTLDEGAGGDVGVGTLAFSPIVDTHSTWNSATRGGHTAVSDARLLRRRRLQGPARHHRAKPAHPPRRHDAPRLVMRHHSYEHEGEGTDTLRLSAATRGPRRSHFLLPHAIREE